MNKRKDSLSDLYQSILLFGFLALEIWVSYLALFSGGGAEQQANLFIVLISSGAGIFGAVAIFLFKLATYITQRERADKKWGWIGSIIHDPEDSVLPVTRNGWQWIKNPFLLALLFLVITSIVGVFQVYQNTFFTALPPRVTQQITEAAQGILSTIPADQEIWIPTFFAGLLLSIFSWLRRQKKIDATLEHTLSFAIVPAFYALSWLMVHKFAHGSSEIALSYVFVFGLISGLLMTLFRSVIPHLVWKIVGNIYQYMNGTIQSNEIILWVTIGINFVLVALFVLALTLRKKTVRA